MSVLRVNYLTGFRGEDVVLATMDRPGVYLLQAAMRDAVAQGGARLDHDGVVHEFRIDANAADLELQPAHVVWRFDRARAAAIIDDLAALAEDDDHPCHQYVDDMRSPAGVLVLSRDEYVGVVFPWQQPAP